ncbi:MAG: hypothetical protein KY469_10770 [Actinobacteria bacterium]|nr:hypothetical protein [Actinomycetota bacterium]
MARVKIRLTRNGPRLLRQSAGVAADLAARAERIAAAAGPGMVVDTRIGKSRARASVIASTPQARRAEATGRALTRSIDAGR